MSSHFHNTTQLIGDELRDKDLQAKSQEDKLYWIMQHLKLQVEWWTRDALNREYTRRFGGPLKIPLKIQSISRALSNLTALWCPACEKKWKGEEFCGNCGSYDKPRPGKLEKSSHAEFRSDENDRAHAWRLTPDPGQATMFETYGRKEGLQ